VNVAVPQPRERLHGVDGPDECSNAINTRGRQRRHHLASLRQSTVVVENDQFFFVSRDREHTTPVCN
jgi:hypothetical protein